MAFALTVRVIDYQDQIANVTVFYSGEAITSHSYVRLAEPLFKDFVENKVDVVVWTAKQKQPQWLADFSVRM